MAKTYTNYIDQYKVLTKNTTAENVALGSININDSIRAIASIRSGKWKWLEVLEQVQTVQGKSRYSVPNNVRKVVDLYVRVGANETSMIYMPETVYDPYRWKVVLASKLGSSNIPRFVYIQDDTLELNPVPSEDGNVIFIRGRRDLRDMGIADYSTGTVVAVPYALSLTAPVSIGAVSSTLTAPWGFATGAWQIEFSSGEIRVAALTIGSAAVTWQDSLTAAASSSITVSSATGGSIVTGTGTSWTVPMAGRSIMIADSSTANKGDGFWYEIESVLSGTVLVLKKQYQGFAIAAGSAAYTIGQVSPIPEAYSLAPLYRAVAIYWDIQGDKQAERYWRLYDGGLEAGLASKIGGFIGQMLDEAGATQEGSYISPNSMYGRLSPNWPEPDVAQSSFTNL